MTPEQVAVGVHLVQGARSGRRPDGRRLLPAAVRRRSVGAAICSTPAGPDVPKFAVELAALVDGISSFPDFAARAAELGARTRCTGYGRATSAAAREALISSLADSFGTRWNDELEAAWRGAYDLTAELMMAGAGRTDPAGEASATAP